MAEVGKWQILGGDLPLKIFKKKMLLKVDFLDKLDNSEQKKNRTRSWFSKKRIYATLYPRSKNSSEFVNFDF